MEASSEKKDPSATLGPKLRQERQRHHLSQEKLAEMVGCDVRSIRRWEQGKGLPDYENRHRLSKALDITLEDFHQLLQPVEEKGDEPLERDIHVSETLSDRSYSISVDHEAQSKHPIRQQYRRALLKWGGIGFAATLVGGGGLFYWFTRSSSSSSFASPSLSSPQKVSLSPQTPPSQMFSYSASPGVGMCDVEWSPSYDSIVCVDRSNHAQVIKVIEPYYNPSQTGSIHAPNLSQTQYKRLTQGVAVQCIAWSPDGTRLVSSNIDNTEIHIWTPLNNTANYYSYAFSAPQSMAWSSDPNRQFIAVCGIDGTVRLWNVTTQKFMQTYLGHKGAVYRAAWSPDSIYLATAGNDGTVRIWNTTKDEGSASSIYTKHNKAVYDVKWSQDGDSIVSASEDATVRIWNAITQEDRVVYRGHTLSVQAAEWSPDGRFIASAGVDTTIRLWDAATGKTHATYPGHTTTVWALSWSPYELYPYLASASEDGTMRVWNMSI